MSKVYNERREQIRALLQTKPFISIKELEELFPDVSGMTLRRDIEYFEREHEAIKVRGGARRMRFITTQTDGTIASRKQETERKIHFYYDRPSSCAGALQGRTSSRKHRRRKT